MMRIKAEDREGRRSTLSVRLTPAGRESLERAASASGRSLAQEVEMRLEATFAEDRMRAIAREEMDRRFGPQITAEMRARVLDKQAAAMASLMRYTDDHPNGGQ